MTYTRKNILSAFEATGIHPINERRVTKPEEKKTRNLGETATARFKIPATPAHGRSIIMHGRRTLKALPDSTPRSQHNKLLVEKLVNAAAKATADNVILAMENLTLRQKATSAADRVKTQSRKELSKAKLVCAADVVKLRNEQENREKDTAERRARAAEKQALANENVIKKSREKAPKVPKKKLQKKKKVVPNYESLDSASENDSESFWEERWSSGGEEPATEADLEEVIVVATSRTTRSQTQLNG